METSILVCAKCKSINSIRDNSLPLCERCGRSLVLWGQVLMKSELVPHASVSDSCVICEKPAPQGNSLCDGRVYHPKCYAELQSQINSQRMELAEVSAREWKHRRTIEHAGTWSYKIRAFFVGSKINISTQEKAIVLLQAKERELRQGVEQISRVLKDLWDYWPEYPLDWEDRKSAAFDDVGGVCEQCGIDECLQVHHRQRIANGGTHRPENLMVLCVYCHGEIHGRDFTARETRHSSQPSVYSHRVDILRQAIMQDLTVHFSYRKYDGERSTRSFKPQRFKRYNKSLCIEGWCYLRNDTRVFAISRMSRISIDSM